MTATIGEIRAFAFGFVPSGWLACDGSMVSIAAHGPLYAAIGGIYGPDSKGNFALPDLRGRVMLSAGEGYGQSPRHVGEQVGVEQVALTEEAMPAHTHPVTARTSPTVRGLHSAKGGDRLSRLTGGGTPAAVGRAYASPSGTPAVDMHASIVGSVGAGKPHENRQPFLAVNYCIAWEGVVP